MLEVKNAIRRTRLGEARDLARAALELGTVAEVVALIGRGDDARERPSGVLPAPSLQ
jgi:hypothetical protein